MPTPRHSAIFRLAQSSLHLAIQFWPEESRQWGLALASELPETKGTLETLQWTLGGLMLFTRASVSHFLSWMKNPPGSPFSAAPLTSGSGQPLFPRRSRLFAVALLAATLLLLAFPQSRIAISVVRASWNGFEIGASDRRTLDNMTSQAENDKDAQTLAFVALALPDSERAMALADRAVALDPSLTWIYSSRFYRPESSPMPEAWRERSLARDPDNAYIHLADADVLAHEHFAALIAHRTPPQAEIDAAIAGDPKWMEQMEQAFRSPRYDSYLRQHWHLICRTWDRNPALSPSIIGYSLWSTRIPDINNLRIFTRVQGQLARQKQLAGQSDQAIQILKEVDALGARLAERTQTRFEQMTGIDLSRQANVELTSLYAASGQKEKAAQASARAQALETSQQSFQQPFMEEYLARQEKLRRPTLLFQSAVVLFVLSAALAVLSFLALELRPTRSVSRGGFWQKALCLLADYAPVAVLVFGLAAVLSFLPIGGMFADYRASAASLNTYRGLSDTFWALSSVPNSLERYLDGSLLWWAITIALSLLAVFLLWRIVRRSRRVQQTAL